MSKENEDETPIGKLKIQLEHEKVMLENWKGGDHSAMPENWTLHEQETFILGMEHALSILENADNY